MAIRIVKLNGSYYGYDMGEDWAGNKENIDDIERFISYPVPVIIVDSIQDVSVFGIDSVDIEIVDRKG